MKIQKIDLLSSRPSQQQLGFLFRELISQTKHPSCLKILAWSAMMQYWPLMWSDGVQGRPVTVTGSISNSSLDHHQWPSCISAHRANSKNQFSCVVHVWLQSVQCNHIVKPFTRPHFPSKIQLEKLKKPFRKWGTSSTAAILTWSFDSDYILQQQWLAWLPLWLSSCGA